MTTEIFNQIIKQAVIDTAYSDSQVNTFNAIDIDPDLNSVSFGATYSDFQNGLFWSRDWVNSGASPDTIKGQYPVLMTESRSQSFDIGYTESSAMVFLLLIDKVKECSDCPFPESGRQTTQRVFQILRAIIDEVYSYGKYNVIRDGETSVEWISEGRYLAIKDNVEEIYIIEDIQPYLSNNDINIREWGQFIDKRGCYTELNIEVCSANDVEFEYKDEITPTLAITKCDDCD